MAGDSIIGTWVVTQFQGGLAKFKFKYSFSGGGTESVGSVKWQDYWDKSSKGAGTWRRSGNQINIDWQGSSTKEYLIMAPSTDGSAASGAVTASYGTLSTVAERVDTVDQSQDLMKQWAANPDSFTSPDICPFATSYILNLTPNTKPYDQGQIGGAIGKVRGLAIHTTCSPINYTADKNVSMCINTWNTPGKKGAHFIINTDGSLAQVVPTKRIAYAQGGNGDPYWLSVEIQTHNSPANEVQLQQAGKLFQWVVNKFGCDKKIATGYVGDNVKGPWSADAKHDYDPITKSICGDDITTSNEVAINSSGLSCHYWLYPSKPCPGKPLLAQLTRIATGV